jgi:hypothetical protein
MVVKWRLNKSFECPLKTKWETRNGFHGQCALAFSSDEEMLEDSRALQHSALSHVGAHL